MRLDELQVKINNAILALHQGDLIHIADLIPDELKYGANPISCRAIEESLASALSNDMRFEDMGSGYLRRKRNCEFRKEHTFMIAIMQFFECLAPNNVEAKDKRVPDLAMKIDSPFNGTPLYKREE